MSETEYECLNSIRQGIKHHLWWAWEERGEYDQMYDAMSYLEDVLWAEMVRNVIPTETIYE